SSVASTTIGRDLISMKTCSKCKKDLPQKCFVKSPRYFDGLYPLCKTCRKASLLLWLTSHTLCSKCGKASHLKYHKYCYHCLRRAKGRSQVPKFGRRALNLHLCSKCQQHLRLRYHAYCRDCALKSNRDWKHANGGNWKGLTPEQRRKAVARRYVKTRIDRGHMIRKPCEVCGHPKSEAHH